MPRDKTSLDQLDAKLIDELESDAKQTYKSLAKKLGVSRYTVANRIQRLLDNNFIKFVCSAAPNIHKNKFNLYIAIDAEPNYLSEVAHKLAEYRQLVDIRLCSGHFNVFASAFFQDEEELSDFFSNKMRDISGVRKIETMMVLREVKLYSEIFNDNNPFNANTFVKKLDRTDIEIINELQRDPKQGSGQMAKKLGINKSTVSRRIQLLSDNNIVRIGIRREPSVLGIYEAIIGIKSYPDKIKEIAGAVANYDQAIYVSICTGIWDILFWAVFPNLNDLGNFVTDKLGLIPGVKDIEIMMNYKLVKYSPEQLFL